MILTINRHVLDIKLQVTLYASCAVLNLKQICYFSICKKHVLDVIFFYRCTELKIGMLILRIICNL
jgi:hypothetical protein